MELIGKIAIITGAARGIGASIATKLASEGAMVILVDRLEDRLQVTTDHLIKKGLKATFYCLDMNHDSEITSFFKWVHQKYSQVDILINNAGISPKTDGKRKQTHDISLIEWEEVIRVNLTGTFLFTKYALPLMMTNRWGRIINISSIAGRTYSRIAGSHYSATKTGVIGFGRTVASEYADYGITVNSVAPGRIDTPMSQMVSEDTNTKFINEAPIEKSGDPQDVAEAVKFLCLNTSGFITGTTIDVNGGLYMN